MTTLITGASGGIGAQLALLCAQHDDELLITGRDADRLAAVKANLEREYHGKVTAITLDLAQPDAAERLEQYTVERHMTIDTLINAAGFGDWTTFLGMDDDRMRAMMQVNMVTLTELCHRFGRRMRTRGHGRILNIASVAAALPVQAGSALAYAGAFAKMTAFGVRGVPTRLAARCAAYMNGGEPRTSR